MHYVEDVRPTKTPGETMDQTPQQIFDEISGLNYQTGKWHSRWDLSNCRVFALQFSSPKRWHRHLAGVAPSGLHGAGKEARPSGDVVNRI